MPILWLDYETKSECDLPTKGSYNYSQHISTKMICAAYAFDDEDVALWWSHEPVPQRLVEYFKSGGQIRCHNAGFDRLITWFVVCPDYALPEPALNRWYCTAAQARANCAPGSLEDVGRFAGATMKKDHRGSQLIRHLCIPRPDGSFNTDPALMTEFGEYAMQDVRAMRAISKGMRDLSTDELTDYHVNERVNDRGVRVDVELCNAAIRYATEELDEIQQIVREVTDGAITSVRSPKMRQWVLDRVGPQALELMTVYKDGEAKYSIDKSVRGNLLILAGENPDEVPPDVAEVIQCADDLWASSVAKFQRAANLADRDDGRVRGAFVFSGGSATGRASSFGLQVHNFPRKCAKEPELVRAAMTQGGEIVPQYGKRVTDVLKQMLRPALLAEEGNMLVVADWSSIEARVNPWLSGRGDDKLEIFRNGGDVYKVNASATFRVPVADVTGDQRQVGKVQELACLSEDTLVLTACGDKRIQDVLPGDLVWDGVNWVRTDGPIYKGEKHVIEYDGLCATPDHLVWVEGQTDPIRFERAAAHGLHLARPRAPYEIVVPSTGEAIDGSETALRKSEQPGVQNLWGARHYIQFWLRYVRIRLDFRKHRPSAGKDGIGSRRQHKALSGGKLALVHQSAKQAAHFAYSQHGGVSSISASTPRNSLRGQHTEKFAVVGADVSTDHRPVGASELQAKRRVWDLLNCGPLHRFTAQGRLVHNCGFAGGVGAFAAMGRIYDLLLPEPEAKRMVDGWRRANPWAMPFWDGLERAYTAAMRYKGKEFTAGRITYLFDGVHLWYALPSGRILCYPYARLEEDGVTYAKAAWKPAADAKEWPRARLWRGLACENVTQATANDILRHALRTLDGWGFEPVLHVHDEIVLETTDPEATEQAMQRAMCTPPAWAAGLPLGIETHSMIRYGKG